MRLGTAIEKLVENYNYAVGKEWVQDKVAWALYHTWKEADEHRAKQTEPQTRTDEDGRVWEYRNGNWWQLGKTENNSEKPNNCEHITEDGVTCAKYPACDDCLDNPLNKLKGSERLVKGSEVTTDCRQLERSKYMSKYDRDSADVYAVKRLGDEIGYGHLMALAHELWARHLEEKGLPRE